MRPIRLACLPLLALLLAVGGAESESAENQPDAAVSELRIVLPLDREAYFIGERVPLAVAGVSSDDDVALDLVHADGRVTLHRGRPAVLLLDTATLAPGEYHFEVNGLPVAAARLFLTSPLRRSAASLQDESTPPDPKLESRKQYSPQELATLQRQHWDHVAQTLEESGVTCLFAMGQADMGRAAWLDTLARSGTMLLVNPDTRPTSFFPVGNFPRELDDMSQRMILTAQANGRYPNFAGFCFGWDTTGYATGGRRGLLQYWGWGDKTQSLRNYLERIDRYTEAEFTRRTGLEPVGEAEYIAYLLSLGRPEFAPAIDLPSKHWLEEIAAHTKPMQDAERTAFEKRLDAWSSYLMGLYGEAYGTFVENLRGVDPTLRHTASVQVDHSAVRFGQYFPAAYAPLDLQYQSTWNDQVGGPDYSYQWLFTVGLLEMHRGDRPTWISNAFGAVHARSNLPGKFVRVAAHGLAWGASGIGFALEGFSNVLGGMNQDAAWDRIQGTAGEMDVRAGREFLQRFAALALQGRGDHGVGILFSRSQCQRQHLTMGFGTAAYKTFVALTRLGYTPRFVTEEDLIAGRTAPRRSDLGHGADLRPADTGHGGLGAVRRRGRTRAGRRKHERATARRRTDRRRPSVHRCRQAAQLGGSQHGGRRERRGLVCPVARRARARPDPLAGRHGRGVFTPASGAATQTTLTQIDAGPDAKYVVAINDSHVKTQADWHQVRETLLPTAKADPAGTVYDCTEEKRLGPIGPIDCDLTRTTARVFAVLKRPLGKTELAATQTVVAGENLDMRVRFSDESGKPLAAVLPFCLRLIRPDGRVQQEFYRAADRQGEFAMVVPIAANAPWGRWRVEVRLQLTGEVTSLPVEVSAGRTGDIATVLAGRVLVRQRDAIDQLLAKGSRPVLPIFASPRSEDLLPVAEHIRTVLGGRGVDVEILRNPQVEPYCLAYDPTEEQQAANARADRGERIGQLQRQTVNGNDWYSSLSGYRFGRPVILLDLASQQGDNPLAEALDGPPNKPASTGLLWPQVSEAFPGEGRAVVQGIHWAFAPRVPALVIQAMDVEGLMAGADSLANPPDDVLTPRMQAVRAELWRQYHVGDRSPSVQPAALTADGLRTRNESQPFAINFVGDGLPLPPDQVRGPEPVARPARTVPCRFEPQQVVPMLRDGDRFVEAGTAASLLSDLRFSDAMLLIVDVPQSGNKTITVDGAFRYSDRKPAWQAVWEDFIELREKLVPKQRRPMEIEVRLDGQPAGTLLPVKTAVIEVPIQLRSPTANTKPEMAQEEAVTQIGGEIALPVGRHELLLIPRNIVDGKLAAVAVGAERQP